VHERLLATETHLAGKEHLDHLGDAVLGQQWIDGLRVSLGALRVPAMRSREPAVS
jgi:hypothetical protein